MSIFHCTICGELPTDDGGRNRRLNTCLGGTVCWRCDDAFVRSVIKTPKSETEKAHDRDYRKFITGKLYPEISCVHLAEDGAEATARLKDRTKFYEVA